MSSGHLPTLAIEEAFYKITEQTLKVHYIINQYDGSLHIKCVMILSNHNVTALDYVVVLSPDLQKSVLHCWYVTAIIAKPMRKLISLVVFFTDNIQPIETIYFDSAKN